MAAQPRVAPIPRLDLADPALRANPYPLYAQLRQTAPLAPATVPMFGQVWLVTRYADVAAVLKDPRFSSDSRTKGDAGAVQNSRLVPRTLRSLQRSMVTVDDPDHARLRKLVHVAFTPRRIERLSARIAQISEQLLDRLQQRPVVDLVSQFALPLPLMIISELMGVPERDQHKFHRWMGSLLEFGSGSMLQIIQQLPNTMRMSAFFESLIRLRRADPQDDLITALVQAEQEGERLSQDELLGMIFLLLLAGHETTVNLIGSGALALIEHPHELRRLHDDPALIETAIEEILRYTNPVEHGSSRFTREPLEMHGVELPAGSTVLAMVSSANRDEQVFSDPDRLDLTRTPNRHLAFGLGIHYCLGAPLARLEGSIALNTLVRRFPDMRLAQPPTALRWRNAVAVRGLKTLPVRLR